jgi:formylglycine-generating enzyme required for sulfatase activity
MLAAALAAPLHAQDACSADVDGDGTVGAADLSLVLSAWGSCAGCAADINDDGAIDAADLSLLLGLWGQPCSGLPWATVLEASPDATVVTNPTLRDAIAATGLPWRVRDNGSGIEMVLVPAGTFNMGCSAATGYSCQSYETPIHAVTISQSYYIGRYEVKQSEWAGVMDYNPSVFRGKTYPDAADRPVDSVSWQAVQPFLAATGLRLPTEAEWEYAYRAGTTTAYHSMPGTPNGTNNPALLGEIAWWDGNAGGQTHVVGGKAANALGLHDMSGNVAEWVADAMDTTYYAWSPSVDPQGPGEGNYRVTRGSSWISSSPGYFRSSARQWAWHTDLPPFYGFRVVRNP